MNERWSFRDWKRINNMRRIQRHPMLRYIWLILLITCTQVSGQFFTKSSKSIPRMGRRSEDSKPTLDQYRHHLIDEVLADQDAAYEDSLIAAEEENLEKSDQTAEVAADNDQPVDWEQSIDDDEDKVQSRDERSNKLRGGDDSLAIRALNTNRLIQYLSSGKPLMSYNRLFRGRQTSLDADQPRDIQQRFAADNQIFS